MKRPRDAGASPARRFWPERHQRLAWTVVGIAAGVSLLMLLAAIFLDTGG